MTFLISHSLPHQRYSFLLTIFYSFIPLLPTTIYTDYWTSQFNSLLANFTPTKFKHVQVQVYDIFIQATIYTFDQLPPHHLRLRTRTCLWLQRTHPNLLTFMVFPHQCYWSSAKRQSISLVSVLSLSQLLPRLHLKHTLILIHHPPCPSSVGVFWDPFQHMHTLLSRSSTSTIILAQNDCQIIVLILLLLALSQSSNSALLVT